MDPEPNTFKSLSIKGWRQFKRIAIDFHPQLTVLTGANGAGKTTLINILSQHFGWGFRYFATPRHKREGGYEYQMGIFEAEETSPQFGNWRKVGALTYSNEILANLLIPPQAGIQYDLQVNGQQHVLGFHVPSHRHISFYQAVGQLTLQPILPEQAYANFSTEYMARQQGRHSGSSPLYRIKESLISMAAFGEGNQYIQGNHASLEAYLGFIDILRKLLPETVGFQNISIRIPDVVLQTKSGEFLIDAASGGLMTLIDLAWQIFMFSLNNKEKFIVTMDEPENHLHPSMQRSLMGNLIRAFPQVQFVIATHSPFMVSSVRDSNVYVLSVEGDQQGLLHTTDVVSEGSPNLRVISTQLDHINKAGSASEILRDVLGVPVTMPHWAEEDLQKVLDTYRSQPFDNQTLNRLRKELEALGYMELYPDAISRLIGKQ